MTPSRAPTVLALLVPLLALDACGGAPPDTGPDDRPNLLLIVADDLGYADLGAYGSDIRTPNIDALAERGILFTRFHTSPMCAPTRAMLLTGNNNHVAGMGEQSPPPFLRRNVRGYEGHLPDRVAVLPRLLREAGYRTYGVGKWHLGLDEEHGPRAAGFERSFHLLHGAANHFDATGFFEGGSVYRADGEEVEYPEGRYATALFTDRLLEFLGSADDGRPFFAYAAYTSPHWPLQVPEDWLDRYRGRYDAGYDVLREERLASLKEAGILAPDHELPPRNDAIRPWSELSDEERRREARKMELYAAMVENLDHHVGRLIDHLEASGELEDTLVLFMSDNGAAGEDFYHRGPFVEYIRRHYDNAYENMGRPDSWVSYGPQWAEAGSAPFTRYKGYTREGGIVTPMIVAGAGVAARGRIDTSYATVMDVTPTFLQLAGVAYPAGDSLRPMRGESMAPLLAGRAPSVHDRDYTTTLYHRGRAFVRRGRWKLSTLEPPFREGKFELFDLAEDPGETVNLADSLPGRHRAMLELWRSRRRQLDIVLPGDL